VIAPDAKNGGHRQPGLADGVSTDVSTGASTDESAGVSTWRAS